MSRFEIGSLQKSSAWYLYRMKERIKMDPDYQRQGDIWTREKRQLLIDTMINGFDVPKLYLHKFPTPLVEGDNSYDYAMIDGKQRAEAMFDFIENRFPLDSGFRYIGDDGVDISDMTYRELGAEHPEIKQDFDSFNLTVVTIDTDDIELIEDLFSRLNEAMPLNAAEKRNAKPGPLPQLVREISRHRFFTDRVPFGNSRYRHYDIIAKMLLIASRETVADTKKAYIDKFFETHARSERKDVEHLKSEVENVLDCMSRTFTASDGLLRSVGMISIYFMLFERAVEGKKADILVRREFVDFEERRAENRRVAEEEISNAEYELLEFDRFSQSPNDGIAMRYRLAVMDRYLYRGALGFADDRVLSSDDDE
ncbi:DUF262 domain-containing protein [Sulfitobacter sabulilitoris]|uniref:DUF262 domain-containing protein n=1 Tax=Sulfitobacter sabulilitoris TaxID=2562655 RepID=A0A5S3PRE1_9RHOB|nr:DUF262 domain-containing protein [Sulfitobacter sabulilitoris]TMM55125.1 DUF262 domain-containing protein [Sulfitobacter sabulilitoris]